MNRRSTMSKPSSAQQLKQFADLEGQYEILKQLGEGAYGVVAAANGVASCEKDDAAAVSVHTIHADEEQILASVTVRASRVPKWEKQDVW